MRRDLTEELLAQVGADGETYRALARYLEELGYHPKRQGAIGFTLSYAHKNGKVLAKMGVKNGNVFCAVKFFGVKDAPQKYQDALRHEIESRGRQYCAPVRNADHKARCDRCPACTGGGLGYFCILADGTEMLRCGAYPIPIPAVTRDDLDGLKALLRAQHEYFMSL